MVSGVRRGNNGAALGIHPWNIHRGVLKNFRIYVLSTSSERQLCGGAGRHVIRSWPWAQGRQYTTGQERSAMREMFLEITGS